MKKKLAFAAAAATALVAPAANARTTYLLTSDTPLYSVGAFSITGSITTNGDTGALTFADIVAWEITIRGDGHTVTFTDLNSAFGVTGTGLIATTTGLFFDFSANDAFNISEIPSTGLGFWSLTGSPGQYTVGVPDGDTLLSGFETETGKIEFATTSGLAGTPEPAAWALMLTGFAGLGAVLRFRRRRVTGDIVTA